MTLSCCKDYMSQSLLNMKRKIAWTQMIVLLPSRDELLDSPLGLLTSRGSLGVDEVLRITILLDVPNPVR